MYVRPGRNERPGEYCKSDAKGLIQKEERGVGYLKVCQKAQ